MSEDFTKATIVDLAWELHWALMNTDSDRVEGVSCVEAELARRDAELAHLRTENERMLDEITTLRAIVKEWIHAAPTPDAAHGDEGTGE